VKLLARFPVKLAAIFLVLVALAGAANMFLSIRIFERRQVEIDQRLNRDLAAAMVAEIEPLLRESTGTDRVGDVMHSLMHPGVFSRTSPLPAHPCGWTA
jgi:hypothetical protein